MLASRVAHCDQQMALQEEGLVEEVQELLMSVQEDGGSRRTATLKSIGQVVGITVLFACICMLVVTSFGHSTSRPAQVTVGSSVGLYGGNPDVAAHVAAYREENPGWDPSYWDHMAEGRNVTEPSPHANISKKCRADEEEFGGLCYKTCNILTSSKYPIRTTAFTCCRYHPCHPFNTKKDMGFCSGFSVGGGVGENCPHPPGACFADEENLLGRCYKKCNILTNGQMPHRLTANACCRMKLSFKCILPSNIRVSSSFDVGGGDGDNVSKSHMPVATETKPPAPSDPEVLQSWS